MFKKLIFLFLTSFALSMPAQTEMLDTLKASFHSRPKPYGTFGGRNSFIQNSRADIWGAKLGISFNKRSRISLGYNFMSTDLSQIRFFPDAKGISRPVLMHMKLNYVSACFEYVYYKTKHWEFSIPLQLGIGGSKYVFDLNGAAYIRDYQMIALYEPMVQTEYYIFPWLGLQADVGLRLMLKNNTAIGINFNSPMYAFGMFLAWDELFKTLFPNTSWAKKM